MLAISLFFVIEVYCAHIFCLDHDEVQGPHVYSFKERDELLHNIIDCMVREYEGAI